MVIVENEAVVFFRIGSKEVEVVNFTGYPRVFGGYGRIIM
jgi:hypothetical protein